ncbi:MAG: transposase [Acidimicrobiales bacterium]
MTQSVFTREVAYVITSLYPEEAGPEELLSLARGHWSIEAMHHIEDVTFAADSSRIRTGNAPANMTLLTRLALSVIRNLGFRTVPDGQRHFLNDRDDLLARLVG